MYTREAKFCCWSCPDRVPRKRLLLYVQLEWGGPAIVRAYYGGNTCPDGQGFILRKGNLIRKRNRKARGILEADAATAVPTYLGYA
jgi:hypothetical protein